jgi:hypothetical protein
MVRVKPNAPSSTVTALRTRTTVPIVSAGVEHGVMLGGASPTRADLSFPTPVRPADRAQFYGGALIRVRSFSGSYCSTGIALVAGPHEYMTTASHCVSAAANKGTWVTYDYIGSGPSAVLGVAPTDAHIDEDRDIALIETNSSGRIWYGPWNTGDSRNVGGVGIYFPPNLQKVVSSGGVSGTDVQARTVTGQWAHWEDEVTGDSIGPGFISAADSYTTVNGAVIKGDSGSPTVASYNGGYHVFGFVSKGYSEGIGTIALEQPAHPGWSCGQATPCFASWYSVYAQSAINDPFDGLTVQTS